MSAIALRYHKVLEKEVSKFTTQDVDFLKELVEHFPYFQGAYFLLSRFYHETESLHLPAILPSLAIRTYDRKKLYEAFQQVKKKEEEEEISSLPEIKFPFFKKEEEEIYPAKETESKPAPRLYSMPYTLENEFPVEPKSDQGGSRTSELINNFLSQPIEPIKKPKQHLERSNDSSLDVPNDLVSETLAKIFIKQEKYSEAMKVYEKLLLQEPEKKAKFARLITELKQKVE